MKFAHLVFAAFSRRKGRSIFTWLSVVTAFILFGVLAALRYGVQGQLSFSIAERLDTYSKAVQGDPLPLSYYAKLSSVKGIKAATYLTGFPGYYQEPQNSLQVLAASPSIFEVFPEARFRPGQLRHWQSDRQGIIVGASLARRFNWKVGDLIPLRSMEPLKDGGSTWYFHLDGIYNADLPAAYQYFFIMHYEYFNEGVADQRLHNVVSEYIERVFDPREAAKVCNAIDALFADSSPQTLTQSEAQETTSYLREFGDIGAITFYIGVAVFATLLLIVGNTMAQSVRERVREFAVLSTVGFRRKVIIRLIFAEALVLLVSGSLLGLTLSWEITRLLYPAVGNVLQTFELTWGAALTGILLSVILGTATALAPVRRVTRLNVSEALRET